MKAEWAAQAEGGDAEDENGQSGLFDAAGLVEPKAPETPSVGGAEAPPFEPDAPPDEDESDESEPEATDEGAVEDVDPTDEGGDDEEEAEGEYEYEYEYVEVEEDDPDAEYEYVEEGEGDAEGGLWEDEAEDVEDDDRAASGDRR